MNQDPPKPKPSLSEFSGILYRLDSTGGLLTGLKASIGTSITQNDYDSIVLHFNTLADSVEAAVPSGRCPYCHARGEGCSFCGSRGRRPGRVPARRRGDQVTNHQTTTFTTFAAADAARAAALDVAIAAQEKDAP